MTITADSFKRKVDTDKLKRSIEEKKKALSSDKLIKK